MKKKHKYLIQVYFVQKLHVFTYYVFIDRKKILIIFTGICVRGIFDLQIFSCKF
jgi:hypothetical protein